MLFRSNGGFALTAVTALVAWNTTGVKSIQEAPPDFLVEQSDCVFTDIFSDAVKTGMAASVPLIEVIADKLTEYGARNIVVDPVMMATSGDRQISENALETLKSRLLPLAAVQRAKDYIYGALSAQLNLGYGSGPMDHMWDLHSRFIEGEAGT